MSFKEISDESFSKAFIILHPQERPERELDSEELKLRNAADNAIRGIVAAMPLLGRYERPIEKYDFLVPGREQHNTLHTSIARIIEDGPPRSYEEASIPIAADTVTQMDARHMVNAMRLGFTESLDNDRQTVCLAARDNKELLKELELQSVGSYNSLPIESQAKIREDMDKPSDFIPDVVKAITGATHRNYQEQYLQAGQSASR